MRHTSTKKPEALRLAELIEREAKETGRFDYKHKAADELRRLHESEIQAAALIKEMLQLIEDWERCSEMLSQRVQELEEQMDAIGAGGVEPLRKTSADTSALRAALEEAEAALEVATSRLSARSPDYPVYVTSEARALEIVRKALGKSHADHFRDATKMMLPTAQVVPEGYALISKDALRAWGKLEIVEQACCYPISAAPKPPAVKESLTTPTGSQELTDPGSFNRVEVDGAVLQKVLTALSQDVMEGNQARAELQLEIMQSVRPAPQGLDAQAQDRLDRLYLALELCSAELFAQCAHQGRAMKYVEQARSALAAEQCARAAQAKQGGVAS